jgi:hypothetical protein
MTTPSVVLNNGGKKKSAVIWRKRAVILPEERGYIFVTKIVAT